MKISRPRTSGGANGQADAESDFSDSDPYRDITSRPLRSSVAPHVKLSGSSSICQRAEGPLEHRPEAIAAYQRVARDRVIAERPALDPFLEAAGVDARRLQAHGEQGPDERAHADAGHAVDSDPGGRELLQHTDVRERAGAPAREGGPNRSARQAAGQPGDVPCWVWPRHDVRLDRLERRGPAVQHAGPWRHIEHHEIAAAQLWPHAHDLWNRAAAGHGENPVALLEAEFAPGLSAAQGPGVEQNEVVCALGEVEQRPVADGRLFRLPGGSVSSPSSNVLDIRPASVPGGRGRALWRRRGVRAMMVTAVGLGRVTGGGAPSREAAGQSAVQRQRQRRRAGQELLEVAASDRDQLTPPGAPALPRRAALVRRASSPTASPRPSSRSTAPLGSRRPAGARPARRRAHRRVRLAGTTSRRPSCLTGRMRPASAWRSSGSSSEKIGTSRKEVILRLGRTPRARPTTLIARLARGGWTRPKGRLLLASTLRVASANEGVRAQTPHQQAANARRPTDSRAAKDPGVDGSLRGLERRRASRRWPR